MSFFLKYLAAQFLERSMFHCTRPSVLVSLPVTQEASFSLAATSTSGTTARSSVSACKPLTWKYLCSAGSWKYFESSFQNRAKVSDVTYYVLPTTRFLVLALPFRPVASIVQPTISVFTACQGIMQITETSSKFLSVIKLLFYMWPLDVAIAFLLRKHTVILTNSIVPTQLSLLLAALSAP